jgi:hypothetical protein
VGAPVYIEEQTAGMLEKMQFEIIQWQENREVVLKMTAGSGMKSYVQFWSIEPTPSGSRVSFREEIELPYGLLGKIITPIAQMMSASTVEKMLDKLKILAECG